MNRRMHPSMAVLAAAVALATVVFVGAAAPGPALKVSITAAPPATSSSASAGFEFSANEPARFECSLDGARPTSCGSPQSYSGLGEGLHVFTVTATNSDRAGTS